MHVTQDLMWRWRGELNKTLVKFILFFSHPSSPLLFMSSLDYTFADTLSWAPPPSSWSPAGQQQCPPLHALHSTWWLGSSPLVPRQMGRQTSSMVGRSNQEAHPSGSTPRLTRYWTTLQRPTNKGEWKMEAACSRVLSKGGTRPCLVDEVKNSLTL